MVENAPTEILITEVLMVVAVRPKETPVKLSENPVMLKELPVKLSLCPFAVFLKLGASRLIYVSLCRVIS